MDRFDCVLLSERHNVNDFDCGNQSLNTWLMHHALRMQRRNYSRVFALVPRGTNSDGVVGYFSLSAASLNKAELVDVKQRSELGEVPAVLLGKLALDKHLHGRGFSSVLLAEAGNLVVRVTEQIGARLMVTDPVDERATHFYARHGFVIGPGGRMYVPIRSLASNLLASF